GKSYCERHLASTRILSLSEHWACCWRDRGAAGTLSHSSNRLPIKRAPTPKCSQSWRPAWEHLGRGSRRRLITRERESARTGQARFHECWLAPTSALMIPNLQLPLRAST